MKTIRELCSLATPGPWNVRELTDEFFLRTNNKHSIDAPDVIVAKTEGWGTIGEANAQLIARLSPDVVLKVVEALEAARTACSPLGTVQESKRARDEVETALSLLNATAQPTGEQSHD